MDTELELAQGWLDDVLFDLCGVGSREFLALARLELDPWAFVDDTLDYVHEQMDVEDEFQTAVVAEFNDRCLEFQQSLDAALTSPERELPRELQFEREPAWDTRYSTRQLVQDIRGIGETQFVESVGRQNSRKNWKRTVGEDKHLRALTEWGTFSFDLTKKWADAKMRVRVHTRKGVPFLGIGAVQVNLHSGDVRCWVSGCTWHRQLRFNPAPCVYIEHWFDREFAEFQVLSILAHLGYHTELNPENYWTPIYSVSRYRDDPDTRRFLAEIRQWQFVSV